MFRFRNKEQRNLKKITFLLLTLPFAFQSRAQPADCTFKPSFYTVTFGTRNVSDINAVEPSNYRRVQISCPSDGHYTYTSLTTNCFGGDWFTIEEDHTPGDVSGNMMLVNASPESGVFLETTINGFKGGTTYEFGVWLMNVCKITDKCPYPLLPNISIRLQTPAGNIVAKFGTGDVERQQKPQWSQYRGVFTTPPSETALILIMMDNAPGGCGNDFAVDDITFRECVKPTPVITPPPKTITIVKQKPQVTKTAVKKETSPPVKRPEKINPVTKTQTVEPRPARPISRSFPVFPAPPPVLTTRENPLVKHIETEAGEIRIDLYDNGEIDGDTVSVYHNNTLLVARGRLSQKPISFRIAVDSAQPHHELIMVAENLGSIPPNTSLMIVTAGTKRYQVFISSTEQKNAKVIFDLKE